MKHGICWLFHRCQTIFFDTHIHPPFFCKDIDYLRDKYDSNHNNSKFDNSTSAKPTIQNSTLKIQHCACATILALASGKADYNTQNSTLRFAQPSKFNIEQFNIAKGDNSTINTQHSTLRLRNHSTLKIQHCAQRIIQH